MTYVGRRTIPVNILQNQPIKQRIITDGVRRPGLDAVGVITYGNLRPVWN